MDITLEQGLGSVIHYIQNNTAEGTEYYFGDIPENYKVPSIYFQIPLAYGDKVTLSSYQNKTIFNIWFMEAETWSAQMKATDMVKSILLDDLVVPYVTEKGEKMDTGFRLREPETRKIENGIVQLKVSFDLYFHPEKDVPKIRKFYAEMQRKNS